MSCKSSTRVELAYVDPRNPRSVLPMLFQVNWKSQRLMNVFTSQLVCVSPTTEKGHVSMLVFLEMLTVGTVVEGDNDDILVGSK